MLKKHLSYEKREKNINQIKTSIIKMVHYKISTLLHDSTISKFVTKKIGRSKLVIRSQYSANNVKIRLIDYGKTYIVLKGRISVASTNNANKTNKKLTFKNNSPFRSCISKINSSFIDIAEDLDIIMLMYYLLENRDNYSMKVGSYDITTRQQQENF